MPDIEITCAECGNTFPFTEREQEYYQERNLTHPKRCKPCREARRSNFGGPKGGGGERQRFEITCDQCGKTDTVPFKPSTGRPVLCGDCFGARRAAQLCGAGWSWRQRRHGATLPARGRGGGSVRTLLWSAPPS